MIARSQNLLCSSRIFNASSKNCAKITWIKQLKVKLINITTIPVLKLQELPKIKLLALKELIKKVLFLNSSITPNFFALSISIKLICTLLYRSACHLEKTLLQLRNVLRTCTPMLVTPFLKPIQINTSKKHSNPMLSLSRLKLLRDQIK